MTSPHDTPPENGIAGATASAPSISDARPTRADTPHADAAAQALNQRIFDFSLDLILIVDSRGNFTRVSPSVMEILGYDPAELVGRCSAEILYPEDLDHTRNEMRKARRTGSSRNFECRYVHKSGTIVTLWWAGAWSDAEHQFYFIGRDITERKKAEGMLRENEARLALAVDTAGIGLASSDAGSAVSRVNAEFNRIYGRPGDSTTIRFGDWVRQIHPEERDRAAAAIREAVRGGGRYSDELRIRQADTGDERWVRIAIQADLDAQSDAARIVAVNFDITDLKENVRLLQSAMSVAQLGTWATDLTAVYDPNARLEWSPESYHICGHTAQSFDNRLGSFWKMVHREDRARAIAAGQAAIENNQPYDAELRITRPDGRVRWVHLRAGIVRDAAGTPTKFTGVMQDVTEMRSVEERLRQAQRMDAIGQLTGGMAHDFNNLLGVIIGNLDLLRLDTPLDPDQRELAEEAINAALRGADLTRRLLAFARRQQLQPERVTVNELVSNIVGLLARTLGEQIPISLKLSDDLWPIRVDPAQLESALVNLATNARDAMPKGGRLMITTANRTLDADYAAVNTDVTPGDYAMVEVSDTGTGIPPEIIARVFEPFFTTKETGKGNGLGLSMIFGFIKQSGGHINVYSEPDKGTTFRLYLPRDHENAAATAGGEEWRRTTAGGNETILVVEDNDGIRRTVRRQLNGLGYRVIEAGDADAALQLLEGNAVGLLLTDVVMPGSMDGIELARTAMVQWPKLKIVLTSGFPEGRTGSQLTGSLRLLSKPYRREELARTLREVLDNVQAGEA